MASLLNRLWSRADFWDKEENEKQKQQFAAQTRAQSQPRPVAQTRPAQKITDNTPGFQWSNNSLTRGLSRGFDQLNPFDNNRTWQQRTPTDTLSLVQEAKQKINTPSQPDKYWSNGIGKTINTGIAGTMRAAAGVGQDTAGLYDLLTPGKGTNRVTKYFKNRGAMWDEKAKEAGVDGMGYHVAQTPLTVASYMVPGKAVKAASAVPRVAKAVSVASNVLEKAPGVAKATGYVDDLVANGNRLQRVGGKLLQSYRQPSAILDVVGDALQNAGHRTSLGQDNSLGTAMQDMGLSLGMQGGVNLLGQAASPVLNTTTRLAKNTINTIAPQQTTTRLVKRPGRLDLQTADLLKAYSDRIVGADPSITGRIESDLIRQVRQIGDELGVDLTNGTPVDQLERIEAILNGYLPQQQTARRLALSPLNEGGYARNPFYRGDDVVEGLSKEQSEFINDYAEMLEGMGSGNGVDITPDGRRITNNFRDADTAGRNMTKADWFEKARKDIESGKAGFGASEEYKKIPQLTKGANIPPSQAVNNKAPVEPVQGRNPTQSQTADTGPLQTVERPVLNPAHKTTEVSQKTPPVEKRQVRSDRTSSSDDIIDLDKVDVNDPFGNSSPVKKLRNEFGRMFVDEDSEMINLLKRVEKETDGQDLVERWLQDSDMVRNSNSIANSKIRTNQNLRDAVQGLRKKEVAEFDAYAAARSELANVKRGLETTSRSVDELQNIVNKHGQKYSQRFESLNRYYNDLANDLYDAGIIDKAKRDAWAKNRDYVRVQRDMEDLLNPGYGASKSRSFGSTSTAKKRTGSKRDILSSTQTALKRTQELQLEIQRNKAASNTLNVLEKHGLATKVDASHAAGKNVIKRFKDGKVEYFATHKDIKRVIDNVNPFQLGIIAKVVSAPTRVFRAGTTALSAPFAVTNYLRDQASSAIYSKSVLRTHNPAAVISGITEGIKDFGGGKNNDLWDKFQRYAGDQTMFDETRNVKNSKAMLNQLRRGGGKYARTVELINPANTVRNLEDLISITEKSTRYQNFRGIYKKTLKETGNEDLAIQKATQAALQNSVNFSRAGSVVRVANLLIPYFNAGIQGSRNVGRSLRDRPLQTVAKSAAFVAAPTIGAVLYNYSSEESKRIYENLPENEKENNIVFVLPGAKQREDGTYEGILKIPKPQGYRELTDPLRVVAEKFAGDTDVKSIGEMAKDMTAAFTGPVQTEDMNKFLSTFVPQALKPTLQAHLNRDLYWGSETVPDYMMEGTDDPTKRAYKGTSGMARWVADQLDVEPIKVEKFIIDSTGSLGRYGINAVDNTLAAQGKIPKEQIGGRSIKDDFSRRMFEARGVEKEEKNMTDGQKYFKAVKEATTGLSPQQKTAWDSYNQSNKDFLGNELYDKSSFAKKQAKAAAYAQFPGLFETDKKIDAQGRQRGEPGNPLYDLNFNQAFKVVQQKAMLPGAKDPELDSLYDHAWYEEFKAKESNYYDKVFADKKDEDVDNPYPKRSKELGDSMNHYYSLDTVQRRNWRNANPGLYDQFKQYYAAKDAWEDRERIKIGLGAISQYKDSYSSGSGGGRKRSLSFEPFKYGKKSSHLNKELRALIEEAGRSQKAFPKAKKTKNYS